MMNAGVPVTSKRLREESDLLQVLKDDWGSRIST